jgi:hypothetical protein
MVTGNCALTEAEDPVSAEDAAGPVEHAVRESAAAARTAVALPAVLSRERRVAGKRREVTELLRRMKQT